MVGEGLVHRENFIVAEVWNFDFILYDILYYYDVVS